LSGKKGQTGARPSGDYDQIRSGIEAVFPDFNEFNSRIRVPGGFRLSLAHRESVENRVGQG
jgi:hypothetical protein